MASLGLIDFVIVCEQNGYTVVDEYEQNNDYIIVFTSNEPMDKYAVQQIEELAHYELRGDYIVSLVGNTIEVTVYG